MPSVQVIQISLGLNPPCGFGSECMERMNVLWMFLCSQAHHGAKKHSVLTELKVETQRESINTEHQESCVLQDIPYFTLAFFLLPAVLLMFLYLQHSEKQRNILPNSADILTGPHKVRGAM